MSSITDYGNAREQLEACEDWLGDIDETFSDGLRSPEDALKLMRYWLANEDVLPECPNEWEAADLIKAIGYDPMAEAGAL